MTLWRSQGIGRACDTLGFPVLALLFDKAISCTNEDMRDRHRGMGLDPKQPEFGGGLPGSRAEPSGGTDVDAVVRHVKLRGEEARRIMNESEARGGG